MKNQITQPAGARTQYNVATLRGAGLDARWSRNSKGAPIIVVRDPKAKLRHQREAFWMCGRDMWAAMQRDGILEGFRNFTLLGDIFSVRA